METSCHWQKDDAMNMPYLKSKFCDESIVDVHADVDMDEQLRVQNETRLLVGYTNVTFAGAQPVSLAYKNINFLLEKDYKVSWKADGTRYLMYINGQDKVYMLDRNNSVFRVNNLFFPHSRNLDKHLVNTLLDGVCINSLLMYAKNKCVKHITLFLKEFVIDIDPTSNRKIPRFLIFDIIQFEVYFFNYKGCFSHFVNFKTLIKNVFEIA